MSVDDFYAAPAALRPMPVAAPRSPRWPVAAGALAVLAVIVTLAVVLWPHSSGHQGPDTGMARLFGQQTRAQLPQPVEAADCNAAVGAFPAIARDAKARAAFVDGCLHP